jgi:hypothetical protein
MQSYDYVDIEKLSITKLKYAYGHKKDYWEISKNNEFPLINIFFLNIQYKKENDNDLESFLLKYKLRKGQQENEIDFLINILTNEFLELDEFILKCQKEAKTQQLKNINRKLIQSLNLIDHEKICQFLNSEKFFEKVQFFEDLFYVLALTLLDENLNQDTVNELTFKTACYYYEYIFRFIEYPIGLQTLNKVELKYATTFDIIPQIINLFNKFKSKIVTDLTNFYYINYLYDPEIRNKKFETRNRDMKKLQFDKRIGGYINELDSDDIIGGHHHPAVLGEVLKETQKDFFDSLKSSNINNFFEARIRDLKNNLFTKVNVLFILFLIDFTFKTSYGIKNWFYQSVILNFSELSLNLNIVDLPTIIETGINEWSILYMKKNNNTLIHEQPILYIQSFKPVITKYFDIVHEINPNYIIWDDKPIDISDFLCSNINEQFPEELLTIEEPPTLQKEQHTQVLAIEEPPNSIEYFKQLAKKNCS